MEFDPTAIATGALKPAVVVCRPGESLIDRAWHARPRERERERRVSRAKKRPEIGARRAGWCASWAQASAAQAGTSGHRSAREEKQDMASRKRQVLRLVRNLRAKHPSSTPVSALTQSNDVVIYGVLLLRSPLRTPLLTPLRTALRTPLICAPPAHPFAAALTLTRSALEICEDPCAFSARTPLRTLLRSSCAPLAQKN